MAIGDPFCWWGLAEGIYIPRFLLSYKGVGLAAKVCFARLVRYCGNGKTECWPSQEELAEEFGVTTRSISSYISELEQDGFLRVEQRGLRRSNKYVLLEHRVLHSVFTPSSTTSTSGQDQKISSGQDQKETSGPLQLIPERSHYEGSQLPQTGNTNEELDLEDPIEVFVTNSMRRTLGVRIKPKHLLERWESAESRHGHDLRRYWLNFLEYFRENRDTVKDPQLLFLYKPEAHSEPAQQTHPAPSAASVLLSEGGTVPQDGSQAPAIASSASIREVEFDGPLPVQAVFWNKTTPAGAPVENWSIRSVAHRNLLDRINEPGYLESLPKICAKAQILCGFPKGKFISFGWSLKEGNWLKLVNGEMDWVIEENKPGRGESLGAKLSEKIRREGKF